MEYINEQCRRMIKRFKTRNPAAIAELLGINLWYRPLGGLKGFYLYERKSRYIVVNDSLDRVTAKVVTAHELGHDTLHRTLAREGMREQTLFLCSDKTELQANVFAAELLIPDEEILSLLEIYEDIYNASRELMLPVELVSIKLEAMNRRGCGFNLPSFKQNFLK